MPDVAAGVLSTVSIMVPSGRALRGFSGLAGACFGGVGALRKRGRQLGVTESLLLPGLVDKRIRIWSTAAVYN